MIPQGLEVLTVGALQLLPSLQASPEPQRQVGEPPLVSHHSPGPQQAEPQQGVFGQLEQVASAWQIGPPVPAAPPLPVAPPLPPVPVDPPVAEAPPLPPVLDASLPPETVPHPLPTMRSRASETPAIDDFITREQARDGPGAIGAARSLIAAGAGAVTPTPGSIDEG